MILTSRTDRSWESKVPERYWSSETELVLEVAQPIEGTHDDHLKGSDNREQDK